MLFWRFRVKSFILVYSHAPYFNTFYWSVKVFYVFGRATPIHFCLAATFFVFFSNFQQKKIPNQSKRDPKCILFDISLRSNVSRQRDINLALNGRCFGWISRIPAISKLVCGDILQMPQGSSRAVRVFLFNFSESHIETHLDKWNHPTKK